MFTNEDYWIIGGLIAANIVFFFIPLTIIIRRMGFSGWWAVVMFIPVANYIGLWVLAESPWPKLEQPETQH